MKYRYAALFLLTVAVQCQAQVHKCQNGVYTDRVCADGTTGGALKLPEAGTSSQMRFISHLETYPVYGRTWQEVYAYMQKKGEFWAWARWTVNTEYTSRPTKGMCTLEDLKITVDGKILMPEWQERSKATPADRKAWDDSIATLKIHEDGHIDHGKSAAILLRQKLTGLGPQPCETLAKQAADAKTKIEQTLSKSDEDYDRYTSHGLRQFNPS